MVQRCLKFKPEESVSIYSISTTIGLIAREGRDLSLYIDILRTYISKDADAFDAFIRALRSGTSPEKVEEILKGLSVQTKGYAYVAGSVFLGKRCPQSWKQKVLKLLFVTERPYFTN